MLCCGGCFVIVIKIKRCINPPQESQTVTRVHRRRRRRTNNSDAENQNSSQDATPTAPPIDKDDLPPSYDDLFPARAKQDDSTT